jgi:hypothetical protein
MPEGVFMPRRVVCRTEVDLALLAENSRIFIALRTLESPELFHVTILAHGCPDAGIGSSKLLVDFDTCLTCVYN